MGSDTLLVNFLGELEFCFFRDWHNYHYIWHRGKIHRKICSYGLVPSTTWKVFFKFLNFAFSKCLIHLREIFIVLQAWSLSQIQRCNSFLMVYIKDYLHWNWLRRVQYWRRVHNSPSNVTITLLISRKFPYSQISDLLKNTVLKGSMPSKNFKGRSCDGEPPPQISK